MDEGHMNNNNENKTSEMQDLKNEIERNGKRHAMRLIKAMSAVITVPEIVADRIHKELSYCSKDAYRLTMKNRNGESENEEANQEASWNK